MAGSVGAPEGNQNARKGRMWSEALKRAFARMSARYGDNPPSVDKGLDRLADRVIAAAMEGDLDAAPMAAEKIGDRLDGKPAQAIVGDEDSPPVQVTGFIKLVGLESDKGDEK